MNSPGEASARNGDAFAGPENAGGGVGSRPTSAFSSRAIASSFVRSGDGKVGEELVDTRTRGLRRRERRRRAHRGRCRQHGLRARRRRHARRRRRRRSGGRRRSEGRGSALLEEIADVVTRGARRRRSRPGHWRGVTQSRLVFAHSRCVGAARGVAPDPLRDALHLARETRQRPPPCRPVDRDERVLELLDEHPEPPRPTAGSPPGRAPASSSRSRRAAARGGCVRSPRCRPRCARRSLRSADAPGRRSPRRRCTRRADRSRRTRRDRPPRPRRSRGQGSRRAPLPRGLAWRERPGRPRPGSRMCRARSR